MLVQLTFSPQICWCNSLYTFIQTLDILVIREEEEEEEEEEGQK